MLRSILVKHVASVALVALAVEAFAIALVIPTWTGDSAVYFELAQELSHGRWGRWFDGVWYPEGIRPPLYPLFLSVLSNLVGLTPSIIVGVQVVLGIASAWLLEPLAPPRLRGPWFYLGVGVFPAVLGYAALLMTEGLAILEIAVLVRLLAGAESHRPRRALLIGVVAGLAVLTRPNLVVAVMVPPAFWAMARVSRQSLALATTVFAVGAAITVSPMVAFNLSHFGRPSPLAYPGSAGTSLYLTTWEHVLPLDDLNALYGRVATPRAQSVGLDREVSALNERIGVPSLTAPWSLEMYSRDTWERATVVLRAAAIERILRDPVAHARRTAWAFWRLWCGTVGANRLGPAGQVVMTAIATSLWALGLLGAAFSFRGSVSRELRAAGLLVAAVALIQPLVHVEGRFTAHGRLPLVLCALWTIHLLLHRRTSNVARDT